MWISCSQHKHFEAGLAPSMKAAWVMSPAVLLGFILLTVHLELPTVITLVLPCPRNVMLIMYLREITGTVQGGYHMDSFLSMFEQNSGVAIHNAVLNPM